MKVKHLVLAAIGAAALTGCQNEVMNQRGYVPAPATDTPPPAVVDTPAVAGPETPAQTSAPAAAETAPRTAAATRFEPMTGVTSSGGVDSTRGAAKRGGRKGGASAAEASNAAEGGVYVVQPGDFPEKIARKLHVKLGDLMKANNLTPESAKRLRIGQKLTIPGKSAEAPKDSGKKGAKGARKNAKGAKPAPAAEVKDGVYVVQPGDFPEKIARKLHVKLADLMKANDLTPEKASRLQIGQKLVVPGATAKAAEKPAKVEQAGTTAPAVTADPVKTGTQDNTLKETIKDAENAQVTTTTEIGTPQPAGGEVVTLESHAVMVEDAEISVEEFARRHGTTVDTLRKINPDMKPDVTVFKKNEVVFVPGK